MIRLQNIYKSFDGTPVLKGLDLEIEAGETLVLLGLSGSGKTTTLKLMNGLERPDRGSLYFREKEMGPENYRNLRLQMGYVIQAGALFPHFTVYENIAVVPRLLRWEESKIRQRAVTLLEKLHLSPGEFMDQYPHQLSGGQQQRIGLARALAADPPVLLMDEPFGALDPITRTSIRQAFMDLEELREKTVVMVTHDVQEAFSMGDRIALMDQGVIQQCAPPTEIITHPGNDFVRSFLGSEQWLLQLKSKGLYERLERSYARGTWSAGDLEEFLNRKE